MSPRWQFPYYADESRYSLLLRRHTVAGQCHTHWLGWTLLPTERIVVVGFTHLDIMGDSVHISTFRSVSVVRQTCWWRHHLPTRVVFSRVVALKIVLIEEEAEKIERCEFCSCETNKFQTKCAKKVTNLQFRIISLPLPWISRTNGTSDPKGLSSIRNGN